MGAGAESRLSSGRDRNRGMETGSNPQRDLRQFAKGLVAYGAIPFQGFVEATQYAKF